MTDLSDESPFVCSLANEDRAERGREFAELFATALIEVRREAGRLELVFDGRVAHADDIDDLLRRERECCPFFAFETTRKQSTTLVTVEVPAGAEGFLDGLQGLAGQR